MNKKIISICVCMLMFATVISVAGTVNNRKANVEKQSVGDSQEVTVTDSSTDWWSMFHHDPQNTGYSTSPAPNTNNTLWSHKTDDFTIASSPAIVDDKLYICTLGPYYMVGSYFLDILQGNKKLLYNEGQLFLDFIQMNKKSLYHWSQSFFEVANGMKTSLRQEDIPGNVYCLDAGTGNEIWKSTIEGFVVASPAVYDGNVYIPTIEIDIYLGVIVGKFYCLDGANGDEIWTYTFGEWEGVPGSSPAVADGKVYIPSIEIIPNWTYPEESVIIGKFLCLNATNGDEIWNHTFGEWEGVPGSSPAVYDGKVYIPTIEIDIYLGVIVGKFFCLDAEDGDEIWSYTFGEWEGVPGSSPAVADGKVYIPTIEININWDYPGESVIIGKFLCLDATNGDEIWTYTFGEWAGVLGSSPAVADGKVYIPTIELDFVEEVIASKFYCLDAEDGDEIWARIIGKWAGVPGSSPAVADGKVYIPTIDLDIMTVTIEGKFICLDATNGDEIWTYTFGEWEGVPGSSPAVADGKVYIPTIELDIYWENPEQEPVNGTIYAFEDQLKIGKIKGGTANVKAEIKNTGDDAFENVDWSISVTGGMLGMINRSVANTIETLEGNTGKMVRALPILGLGKIEITVTATVEGISTVKKTVNGFVLLFFVIMLPE